MRPPVGWVKRCRSSAVRWARCSSGGGESRYLVGELLDSWVETPAWWQRGAAVPGGASAELVATQEVWRVEAVRAGRSRTSFAGVYDLSWDAAGNRWWLVRVHD